MLFKGCDMNALALKSFKIFCFLLPKGQGGKAAVEWAQPAQLPPPEDDAMFPYYAGIAAIFGGRGAQNACHNCAEYSTINVTRDVSNALLKLGLTQYDVTPYARVLALLTPTPPHTRPLLMYPTPALQ